MRIAAERRDGVLLLTVEETRIHAAVAVEFRDTLVVWIGPQVSRVIIDLSAVSIMDSTGLGALVAAVKTPGAPRVVALAAPSEPVATLLRLARMEKLFPIFDTVAEAAASFRDGPKG
jgi:anti-sigma B factor antagonist